MNINGFDKEQVFILYDYLVAYEEKGIGYYKSNKNLINEHPCLSSLIEFTQKVKVQKSDEFITDSMDFKKMTNEIICTKNKGNLLLSFLLT